MVNKPSSFVIGKADAFGGVIIAAGEFPALACFVPTVDVLALQFAFIRINHFATHRFHITHIGLCAYLAHRHTLARQLIVVILLFYFDMTKVSVPLFLLGYRYVIFRLTEIFSRIIVSLPAENKIHYTLWTRKR